MNHTISLLGVLAAIVAADRVTSQGFDPSWNVITPATTGIPGDDVRLARFDPAGRMWVSARYPFYQEGGVGVLEQGRWTTFSNVNSPVPNQFVNAIGFDGTDVWIGTDNGIARYDGSEWVVWNPANSPMPGGDVRSLSLDASGGVWMTYVRDQPYEEGVAWFDGAATWRSWTKAEIGFVPSILLDDIAVGPAGDVWVGTSFAGGCARWNGSQWEILNASSGYTDFPCRALNTGRDGRLWADWGGIRVFDGTTWQPRPGPLSLGTTLLLTAEPDGSYWMGTSQGFLRRYSAAGVLENEWFLSEQIYTIDWDSDGVPWVSAQGGVRKLENDVFTTFLRSANTGLPDYSNVGVTHATDGRVWIATSTVGVASTDGPTWRCFNPYSNLEPWPFNTNGSEEVLADPDGSVWVTLGPQGVGRWDGTQWEHFPAAPNTSPREITRTSDGRVWVGWDGLDAGIGYFDGQEFALIQRQNGYPAGTVLYDLRADRSGNLWIATPGGLWRYDGVSFSVLTSGNSGLPSSVVTTVAVDADGGLWVGTDRGLARFDGQQWQMFTVASGALASDYVTNVQVDASGAVWVSAMTPITGVGGLHRTANDGATWSRWRTSTSPLPHEQIEELAFDRRGQLWATTRRGTAVVRSPALARYGTGAFDLAGRGLPVPGGDPFELVVRSGPSGQPGALILSAGAASGPVIGGQTLLVDVTQAIAVPLLVGAGGTASVSIAFPASPPAPDLYSQVWATTSTGGLAASNGLVLVSRP